MESGSDTITAPITAPGQAAVAVVRVSGPGCRGALQKFCFDADRALRFPRRAVYLTLYDVTEIPSGAVTSGAAAAILDRAIVTFFAGPESYTGEDVLEIALHGSTFIVRRFLEGLQTLGIRLARAGEFTERAFLNGKMDLSQAEAVLDVIHAETELQARLAQEQLDGRLSDAVSDLGEPLRDILAEIEANIDFPDEDIDPKSYNAWDETICAAERKIASYLATFRSGRLCRDGARVVLVGVPNAGKSSLLNALVGEDRVIVTPIAGTTRDSVEEVVSLGGLKVSLWDTAGLVDEADPDARAVDVVERLGIERSWKKASGADLVVFVFDASAAEAPQTALLEQVKALGRPYEIVLNKCDAISDSRLSELLATFARFDTAATVTAISVTGDESKTAEQVRGLLQSRLLGDLPATGTLVITHERHRNALVQAQTALARSREGIDARVSPEFVSADVRSALLSLTEIVGATHTEDILGRVFGKFCIGK